MDWMETENIVASFKAAHERTFLNSLCAHKKEEEIEIHFRFSNTATETKR